MSGDFLKCDTPTCDHFEMIPVIAENVGRPCPRCGANLLTEEDFVTFRIMSAATKAANDLILAANPDAPLVLRAMHVHDGVIRSKTVESPFENPFPNGRDA